MNYQQPAGSRGAIGKYMQSVISVSKKLHVLLLLNFFLGVFKWIRVSSFISLKSPLNFFFLLLTSVLCGYAFTLDFCSKVVGFFFLSKQHAKH